MLKSRRQIAVILIILSILIVGRIPSVYACSMYKVTLAGKTMVGCNEDAWRTTPHIWFENRKNGNKYGAAFTGSRFDGSNGYAPQSGMNEAGLAFSRLSAFMPERPSYQAGEKKKIENPTQYLKDIMHQCRTIEEVKAYISQYYHSYFIEDVFIYIEKSGKYLVVEPYDMIEGTDSKYVLSNFCPGITSKEKTFQFDRYRKGYLFREQAIDTSLKFCTALSDTMHVCRPKIGDGTLLTSIWDLSEGNIYLYFYHDYKTKVHFKLSDELVKGDHIIPVTSLFTYNAEFEKLKHYKTPHNSLAIRLFIMFSGIILLITTLYFLISAIRFRKSGQLTFRKIIAAVMGALSSFYLFILFFNINMYYFPAPYKDPISPLVSLFAYMPLLILFAFILFAVYNYNIIRYRRWKAFSIILLSLTNVIYLVLIGLFQYWEFYTLF